MDGLDAAAFPGRAAHPVDRLDGIAVASVRQCRPEAQSSQLDLEYAPGVVQAGLGVLVDYNIPAVRVLPGAIVGAVPILGPDQSVQSESYGTVS